MSLSYREQILLSVLLVVALIVGGYYLVFEPMGLKLDQVRAERTNLQQEYAVSQKSLVDSVEASQQTLHDTISKSLLTLQSSVAAGEQSMRDTIARSQTELMSTVSANQRDFGEALTTGQKDLQDILREGAEQLRRTYSEGSKDLNQVLIKSGEMTQEISTLLINGQAEAAKLRENQVEVESRIGDYFEQMRNQINRLQDDLQASVIDIFAKFTDLTTMTLTQSDEQSQQMLSSLTEQATQLMNTLDDQVRDLSFLVRDVSSEIAGLNKTLDGSIERFGEQMQDNTQKTFESFDQGLSDIVAHLGKTIQMIGDAVDDLPGAVISVRDWVESGRTDNDRRPL